MEKVEKILLLAVLGVALMIIAVMSFLPEPGQGGGGTPVAAGPGTGAEIPSASAVEESTGPETAPSSPSAAGKTSIGELLGNEALPDSAGGPEAAGEETGREIAKLVGFDPKASEGESMDPDSTGGRTEGEPEPLTLEDGAAPPKVGEEESSGRLEPEVALAVQSPHPDYLEVEVRQGDCLSSLVERVCGCAHPRVLDLVTAANGLEDPNALRVGMRLLIPKEAVGLAKEILAKRGTGSVAAVEASVRPGRGSETTAGAGAKTVSTPPAADAPLAGRLYRVRKGDSLWSIAAKVVGKKKAAAYVLRIQKMNPGRTTGVLLPGTEIRLP